MMDNNPECVIEQTKENEVFLRSANDKYFFWVNVKNDLNWSIEFWPCANLVTVHLAPQRPFRGAILNKSTNTNPMTSEVFSQILHNCSNDNGQIRWSTACQAAKDHGVWDDFRSQYGTTATFGGVDVGEFLDWLGYWSPFHAMITEYTNQTRPWFQPTSPHQPAKQEAPFVF